ncbi:MAG: replicative DNA helicase [Deltaproteobacteria bacterium]|nr:replicative DNA helicase [Deltaproteobacteria bacterium]
MAARAAAVTDKIQVGPPKVPPQNLEAEQAVLGGVLIAPAAMHKVAELLTPIHFYRESHALIFEGMLDLYEDGEPIDVVTLTERLRKKQQLDRVGGATYLSALAGAVVTAANVSNYARIVHEKALLRSIIDKGTEIAARAYDFTEDVERLLDEVEQSIFQISGSRIKPSFFDLNRIIKENIKTLESAYQRKEVVTGVPSGFKDLDKITAGFQRGDLIIIAGRPSMGKTALALDVCRHAAIHGNIPVAIFSLEMSKEQLGLRMLCSEARVDSGSARTGFLEEGDFMRLIEAASLLSEAPIYIDDTPALNVLEVRAKSRRLMLDKGVGLVVVDYLQLMRGRQNVDRREQEISEISQGLKALAKELSIPVIALSQLNRKVEERHDKRPLLSDLRESGAIEQDADVIAFIYRDEVYNKSDDNPNRGIAEVIVGKQRNGPTGNVNLAFLSKFTRFENLAYAV